MAYAIVSLDGFEWPPDGRVSLTDPLGCTDTRVDAVRPGGTGTVAVSTPRAARKNCSFRWMGPGHSSSTGSATRWQLGAWPASRRRFPAV